MRGWLANFFRTEIPSFHRICQKTADEIIYMSVCECTNVPGRVEKRDGLRQTDVCQQANLDFTINMPWFTAQKLSASISCATQSCTHTHIHIYLCIRTRADFSQTSRSYSKNHRNNGMGRVSPNSISTAFFGDH